MTQATDTDIRDIKTSIEANTKAIGDLTSSVSSLREEMRVGFANIETKFANVTTQITRLDGKIDNLEIKLGNQIEKLEVKLEGKFEKLEVKLEGKFEKLEVKLEGKFEKLDERTKLSFWGFILRGLVLTALIGVGTYLLPVVAEYVHKLPPL